MTRIISISGIDGCGKTTIIEGVRAELEAKGYKTIYLWLRYNHYLTRFFHALCRLIGFTHYEWHDGIRIGYHEFYRSRIISNLAIIFNFVDTLFTSIILVYIPRLFTKRIIICDRWVIDMLIDLQVDTRKNLGPDSFWGRIFLKLIPADAECFVILRNSSLIEAARPEHVYDKNYLPRSEQFTRWSKNSRCIAIDNNGSIDSTVHQILSKVRI